MSAIPAPRHQILSIEPSPAPEPGALDGWEFRCSCGEHASYTFESITRSEARKHIEYMQRTGR